MQTEKLEELLDEEMYVLVAPDGSTQLTTLAPDFETCAAMIKMLEKAKIGDSPAKLFQRGFQIMPVKVTILANGTAEEGFQKAKSKIS